MSIDSLKTRHRIIDKITRNIAQHCASLGYLEHQLGCAIAMTGMQSQVRIHTCT